MISIGACILGERPRVAVAIRDGVDRPTIEQAVAAGADLIELRIDQFSDCAPDHVRRELRRLDVSPAPVPSVPLMKAAPGVVRKRSGWFARDHPARCGSSGH